MEQNDIHRHEISILGVFETFKTSNGTLTKTALRQRGILGTLASQHTAEERTRTGISRLIVKNNNTRWKNVYSGIFHDIDDVLIPLGLVEEAGRVPPKRGPKVLQESGIPYYHLTREGRLVALATNGEEQLQKRISLLFATSSGEESKMGRALGLLASFAPALAYSILDKYVRAYCDGKVKRLLPLSKEKLGLISDVGVRTHTEFLKGVLELKESERERIITLFNSMNDNKH